MDRDWLQRPNQLMVVPLGSRHQRYMSHVHIAWHKMGAVMRLPTLPHLDVSKQVSGGSKRQTISPFFVSVPITKPTLVLLYLLYLLLPRYRAEENNTTSSMNGRFPRDIATIVRTFLFLKRLFRLTSLFFPRM